MLDSDKVRSLLKDLREVRQAKSREGVPKIDYSALSVCPSRAGVMSPLICMFYSCRTFVPWKSTRSNHSSRGRWVSSHNLSLWVSWMVLREHALYICATGLYRVYYQRMFLVILVVIDRWGNVRPQSDELELLDPDFLLFFLLLPCTGVKASSLCSTLSN
jgi:hypothetical protein